MNLDELNNSASDSDSDHSADPVTQEDISLQPPQEGSHLPSIPFDPEWVSPFTLPPLPALRKNRGPTNLLRSPDERLHQRSTSSAYYAAAWGSPYATPSPNRSPPRRSLRGRSQDLETSSPLSSRTQGFTPESTHPTGSSQATNFEPSSSSAIQKRASSWDRSKSLNERFNWLSESDLSGSEADVGVEQTPTRDTYLKTLKASVDKVKIPRSRPHQVHESVATITQDNFDAVDEKAAPVNYMSQAPQAVMDPGTDDTSNSNPSGGVVDKPLPNLPPVNLVEKKVDMAPATASPDSSSRPHMPSTQSFQRPKRKVVWKGKTCIIALPLTDRENAGLPPLLSAEEVKERMRTWAIQVHQDTLAGFGQSRSLYPDPQDLLVERKQSKPQIGIPDQSEWDAWVEYLKEEKLRALGVTPSNSEAPMSAPSPFSSTMSRVSSTYPSVAASPPIGTLSANGNPVRIASNTFSPPLGHSAGMSMHGGSHGPSPSISGYPGPMHGYKQSIAQPRMTSPYDYPVTHPGSFAPGMRSTPNGYGMRQFSPPIVPNLQSLGQVLSPTIPLVPSNDNGRGMSQNPTMEQIRQQQQRQQQLHQHMMQHQRQYSYLPPPQSRSADNLPRTPILESPKRHTPEIMHPTPRSHRHNLSAALQKGIEDAEAADNNHPPQTEDVAQKLESDATKEQELEPSIEDEQEPDLPVLKRPETLADGDEKSEIETNPSIAASPLLMDEKNPFAAPFSNLQQIKDALQPQSQHKPKPSISKLNVEAPAFDPQATFPSSNFVFSGQTLQRAEVPASKPLTAGVRPSFTPKNLSISKLNVDAPTFTPSFLAQSTPAKDPTPKKDTPVKVFDDTPSKSSFTFSSPAFNVDAPEFKPGQSFSFGADTQALPFAYQPMPASSGSIFGNVTVDPNSKVNRRGTKPVPIIRPQSSEGKQDDSADDEEGRPSAPTDRQKRARRGGGDDDNELLFANSAPFDHAEGLSSKQTEPETAISREQTPELEEKQDSKSGAGDVDLGTLPEQKEDVIGEDNTQTMPEPELQTVPEPEARSVPIKDVAPSPTPEPDQVVNEDASVVAEPVTQAQSDTLPLGRESADAILDNDRHDTMDVNKMPLEEATITEDQLQAKEQISDAEREPATENLPNDHKSKSSLSALAKPFEFRPGAAISFVPATASAQPSSNEPKSKSGLMASRFATSSPTPTSPQFTSKPSSPPRDLYEYIKPDNAHASGSGNSKLSSRSESPSLNLPNPHIEATPQLMKSIEESLRSEAQLRTDPQTPSHSSRVDESMPSYEEIDAVMKQFENNPELGVQRDDTPVKSTPLIDMRLAPTFRSDAPSPSPRRMIISPEQRADWGLGIHKLNDGNDEVSDWNDEFSPRQEDKLQSQAQYFDNRVNDLVGSILEDRLLPFEDTLQTIQQSLVSLLDGKSKRASRRSISTENRKDSDADDEDDEEMTDNFSTFRSRSPSRNQRKADKIRSIVMEAMSAYQPPIPEQPVIDMSEIQAALDEMRQLSQQAPRHQDPPTPDIRTVMEDVISNHPQFQTLKKQDDLLAIQETNRLKVDVLEDSLREAEKLVEQEKALRRQTEEDMAQLNLKLLDAQEKAASHHDASEEAHDTIAALMKDKEAYHALQSKHSNILDKNKALEDTLAEYRITSESLREESKLERARNQDLIQRMHNLRQDFNDKAESRQALQGRLERLQDRMDQLVHDVHADEEEWRRKEHELIVHNKTTQAALDHEIRHRTKIELELDTLDREHKENMRFKMQHEQAGHEISRLQEQITKLSQDAESHQDKSFRLEKELAYAKDSAAGEVSKAVARLQSELEAARAIIENLETDSNAQIARLQKRLDDAELDLEDQKAKHDNVIADTVESHNQALHDANQKRENALEEQHTSHERKLNDLRERHTRALHNSYDDRSRLEHQLNEKMSFNDERTKHLESQIKDLEERLEISKSAARAAVEAATAKAAAGVPTPAPSVNASPPHRLSSASLQMVRGTDVPEKMSPQAMRESIMVLQDQLQNREQTIEQLETEIASLDKDAPMKIKERDNEITLLRELLGVRVDDLNEIIGTLSQSNYDREAAKNAAIRLKANLQMEQQLKERAANSGSLTSALPSVSTISNYAQSPRALPMAAAAAWGNWRKARDFSLNAVSDIASNISQTPSKSNLGSSSNFLAGMITPPSTSQRTPSPSAASSQSPPTMRPLAAAAAAAAARKTKGAPSEARPLRTYSTQARTLSSRQSERRRGSNESTSSEASKQQSQPLPETPTTPLASKGIKHLDLSEDIDDDASPYNESEQENFDEDNASKAVTTA